MSFADWSFYIHATPKDQKVSRLDTLTQVEKTLGRKPDALKSPELIDESVPTWNLFLKLPVINLSEIKFYSELTGENIQPWQVEALLNMNKLKNKDYSRGR